MRKREEWYTVVLSRRDLATLETFKGRRSVDDLIRGGILNDANLFHIKSTLATSEQHAQSIVRSVLA